MKGDSPIHKQWLEISIRIDPAAQESVGSFFFDLGCEGIVTESFRDETIRAYLPIDIDPEDLQFRINLFLENIMKIYPEIDYPELRIEKIEDEDWELKWRKFFKQEIVTPNLLILPAWESPTQSFTGHIIKIDPGPAFGTGQHPSTKLCLKAMEEVSLPKSWNMLDVGTGSGILAIYGSKLGAKEILAIDIDKEAILWAERNIDLNRCRDDMVLSDIPLQKIDKSFTLITANLIFNTILELLPYLKNVLSENGRLILSGLLEDQVDAVQNSIKTNELVSHQILYEEEWACLIVGET